MKAKLIFDLDDPDHRMEFARCNNAYPMYSALCSISEHLRQWRKYDAVSEKTLQLIQQEIDDIDLGSMGG